MICRFTILQQKNSERLSIFLEEVDHVGGKPSIFFSLARKVRMIIDDFLDRAFGVANPAGYFVFGPQNARRILNRHDMFFENGF